MTYANAGEKPAAQIVTNDLRVELTGSINGPIAGNTNWPLNSMDVAPLYTLSPVYVSVTADGGGFQAVNLHVLGDAIVDSGGDDDAVHRGAADDGRAAGGRDPGEPGQPADPAGGRVHASVGHADGVAFGPAYAFQWPGGATFIAGTTLQTFDADLQRVVGGVAAVRRGVLRGAVHCDGELHCDERHGVGELQHGSR